MFTVNPEHLEQIKNVCKLAPVKSPIESLSCVLISASNKKARFTCGDMTIEMKTAIDCEVESGIEALVNAQKFSQALQACNGATVSLKADHLLIKKGRRQFKIQTLNPESYPEFPSTDNATPVEMPSAQFIQGIKNAAFAAAKGDVRYILNGVYCGNNFVGLNGHRLYVSESGEDLPGVIVPIEVISKIPQIDGKVFISDSALYIENDNESFTCKLVDGKYPSYSKMLNVETNRQAVVNRDHLIESLKSALIAAPDDSRNVLFKFGKESEIQSTTGRIGSASIGFDCDCSDEFEVGFNGQYFLDMLNAVDDESVTLEFNDSLVMLETPTTAQIIMMVRI